MEPQTQFPARGSNTSAAIKGMRHYAGLTWGLWTLDGFTACLPSSPWERLRTPVSASVPEPSTINVLSLSEHVCSSEVGCMHHANRDGQGYNAGICREWQSAWYPWLGSFLLPGRQGGMWLALCHLSTNLRKPRLVLQTVE